MYLRLRRYSCFKENSYSFINRFARVTAREAPIQRKDLFYHTADGVIACRRMDEEKILQKPNHIMLPHLYQTEVLFRSHDQMGHQGTDKVQQRILHRFDWPGLRKACETWVNACLACLQVKDPRKVRSELGIQRGCADRPPENLHDRVGIQPNTCHNRPLNEVGRSGALPNSLSGGDL